MYRRMLLSTMISIFALVLCAPYAAGGDVKKLAPGYRSWLDHDVVYLISHDERDEFLALTTDQERDNFIQHFWDVRNPSPGAPDNPYKTEIYRRIAYANERYGTPGQNDGWRTDRGRVYIQLGEPKQHASYLGASETKPFEIWFYENANPALPPYFYILFYQKDIGGDFKIYSPNFDGPDKLTTNSLTINNRLAAFQRIDNELGREVARTTLSLIPTEPVDVDTATTTMSSDLMLAVLRNLPNHPLTKQMIARNEDLLSNVSHRIILSGDYLDVLTTTLRDRAGDTYVNYLLRVKQPVDFAIVKEGERYYYSAEVNITIHSENGAVVMTQNYPLAKYMTGQEYEQIKNNIFGVEGILPLPPGKYKAEIVLTNKAKQSAWKVERSITVDGAVRPGLAMSQVLGFSSLSPAKAQFLPFSVDNYKFTPQLNDELTLLAGQSLNVMYQLWNTPGDPTANEGKTVHVEYTYGRLGAGAEAKKVEEDIPMNQFDRFGSMLTGKVLPTQDLPPGNYRLVIAATDPVTRQKAYSAMTFRISSTAAHTAWDVYDESIPEQYAKGDFDLMRGESLKAMGRANDALVYLKRAAEKNPANEKVRAALTGISSQPNATSTAGKVE